jgi:hypothetical protein
VNSPPRKTPPRRILAIISTILITTAAHADLIDPGDSEDLSPTLLQGQPEFDGTLIAQQTIPFNLAYKDQSRFAGDLLNEVVRNPQDNTLSFYYSVLNPVDSQQLDIWVIDPNNFKRLQTDLTVLSVNADDNWPVPMSRPDVAQSRWLNSLFPVRPNLRAHPRRPNTNLCRQNQRHYLRQQRHRPHRRLLN